MEDHHVDRPGVEAQQCVELTGTNSSFGLITLITRAHLSCPSWLLSGFDRQEKRPNFSSKAGRWSAGFPCFAGLVVIARSLNPIPFRTRPLNSSAPMVLRLKAWESRSPPGLPSTESQRKILRTFSLRDCSGRSACEPMEAKRKSAYAQRFVRLGAPSRTKGFRGVEQPGSSSGS